MDMNEFRPMTPSEMGRKGAEVRRQKFLNALAKAERVETVLRDNVILRAQKMALIARLEVLGVSAEEVVSLLAPAIEVAEKVGQTDASA